MLLLVMTPEHDQVPRRRRQIVERPHHRNVDVPAIRQDFIERWAGEHPARRPRDAVAFGFVVAVVEEGERGIERTVAPDEVAQEERLEEPCRVGQVPLLGEASGIDWPLTSASDSPATSATEIARTRSKCLRTASADNGGIKSRSPSALPLRSVMGFSHRSFERCGVTAQDLGEPTHSTGDHCAFVAAVAPDVINSQSEIGPMQPRIARPTMVSSSLAVFAIGRTRQNADHGHCTIAWLIVW